MYVTNSRLLPFTQSIKFERDGLPYNYTAGQPGEMPQSGAAPAQTTYSFRSARRLTETDSDPQMLSLEQRRPLRHPPGDYGHEFWTTRTSLRFSHPRWLARWRQVEKSRDWMYSGPLVPAGSSQSSKPASWGISPPFSQMSSSDRKLFGARAIEATIPTAPSASLAQFLGELKDLPSLVGAGLLKERASVYRGLGSEYLNVQFGWVPFIKDLTNMVSALRNQSELLTQFYRDSGNVVRRQWKIPSIVVAPATTSTVYTTGGPLRHATSMRLAGYLSNESYVLPVTREDILRDDWSFVGAYTYHVPLSNDLVSRLERFEASANLLLGSRITPSVLWELAPWSWLIDWHGSIGTALSNASALAGDELVLKYGYLMRHQVAQRTYRVNGIVFEHGPNPGSVSSVLRRETKERVRADPYGFTLAPTSYSTTQWAILGALGLTRAPRILR